MFLCSPASYLSVADVQADTTLDLTDAKGNPIPEAILGELLEEHSGAIDAYIKQSFLPQEQTLRLSGTGSNQLVLGRAPLIYVKQVKIVLPTTVGFEVPLQSLLIDYQNGTLTNLSPLVFQGVGTTTLFPLGIDIDVTAAWGLNYAIAAPQFTVTPQSSAMAPLPRGKHAIGVSSVTMNGESLPNVQGFGLPDGGAVGVTVTNVPGALKYYIYIDNALAGEIQAQALGSGLVYGIFDASIPQIAVAFDATGARRSPATTDTTAWPLAGTYAGLRRALKMMLQQTLWEFKNPTNRGLFMQTSGPKRLSFKEGAKSTFAQNIQGLLDALVYQGV